MTVPSESRSGLPWSAVLTTVLTISALYAPQPLLPVLQEAFGVSREAAAALTTATFIPLALAPLAYGELLERVPAAWVLRGAVLLLAASEFAFAASDSFGALLGLRLGQGLLIPALLTAAMTFMSRQARRGGASRALAVHVAATIVGGLLGRSVSGALATVWGWRASFLVLGASLVLAFAFLWRLPGDVLPPPAARGGGGPGVLLRRPELLRAYATIFAVFCVFAAVMNFLPFRLTELRPDADAARIGLMYAGYVMGVVTSLAAPRVVARLGGQRATALLGVGVLVLSLLGLAVGVVPVLWLTMFVFCGAMFLVHATVSGLVNGLAGPGARGRANGLYVAFYYGGGAVGSFAPGWIYRHGGWGGFLAALALVAAAAWLAARGLPERFDLAE